MSIQKLRIIGTAKDALLAGPRSIYIDITTACNINCNFCWIHSPLIKRRPSAHETTLDLPTILGIIETARDWHTDEIYLSGDGEPTLHPHLTEIIETIKNKRLKLFLATNATFPRKLLPSVARVDHLYIDLCSPDEKSFRTFQAPRNVNLYQKIVVNLKVLSQLRVKYRKPYLNVAFIINKTNYETIPRMLDFCDRMGIDELTFRIIETTPFTRKLALSATDKQRLKRIIDSISGENFGFNHNLLTIGQGLTAFKQSPYNIRRCYTGWFSLLVDFNKDVSLCCHNENLKVGNLRSKTLKEIWEGRKAHQLRLKCKYHFDLKAYPFRKECEWCHWSLENHKIDSAVKNFNLPAKK